uniref:Uncharacterized protein n=1 Tax=Ascaris lumbricoides TaxID=6252 RepID=A0A0M3IAM8_ASCLU
MTVFEIQCSIHLFYEKRGVGRLRLCRPPGYLKDIKSPLPSTWGVPMCTAIWFSSTIDNTFFMFVNFCAGLETVRDFQQSTLHKCAQ